MRVVFFLLVLSQVAVAQFSYRMDQSIPVVNTADEAISLPWAGGLNAVQFNTMHLNEDAEEDIVLYDRMGAKVLTYLRINNAYQYAPEYETMFPAITYWLLLRDYNGDGRKDVFTGDNLGIRVYENTSENGQPFTWKLVQFATGFPGAKSQVLLTKGVSFKINLQLNYDDLPSIADADGDGDLDIFNPSYSSTNNIEFHRNYSVERYGTKDSLDFERITLAWAGVTDCGCGSFAFNGEPCPGSGRVSHSGGKSVLALDVDNDGDQDVIFSESTCTRLYLLRNDGTDEAPVVSTVSLFPSSASSAFMLYPAAYFEDGDGDGVRDLIVSPNTYIREYLFSNFQESVWLYKNTGTTAQPNFAEPNTDFLQENMVDEGDNAAPAFFDYDGDGDYDLFIGNYSIDFRGTISYFENIGTAGQPSFKRITNDFMGLSAYGFVNVRPSFADLNGDATWDLVLTATNLSFFQTQLYYFPNANPIGGNFQELLPTGFTVFPYEVVVPYDVNSDGKCDLLVGRQNGSLEFWSNTGTGANPAWTLADDSFAGVGANFLSQYPVANISDLNGDRKLDLLYGDLAGNLTVIDNFKEASAKEPLVVYNALTEEYQSIGFGGRAWPVAVNIFRTDKPAIVVGNILGGLFLLAPAEGDELPKGPIIDVFPNPVDSKTSNQLTIRVDRPTAFNMVSIMGQEVTPVYYLQAFQDYSFTLPPVSNGVYLLVFSMNGSTCTRKIVIR